MGFRVFQIPDQGVYFIVLIVCAVSCIAAVVLRFMATRRVNRKPAAEDWFALAAVMVFLARIGCMLYCMAFLLHILPRSSIRAKKRLFVADQFEMCQ